MFQSWAIRIETDGTHPIPTRHTTWRRCAKRYCLRSLSIKKLSKRNFMFSLGSCLRQIQEVWHERDYAVIVSLADKISKNDLR
jgi:hypothetical protein